MSRIEEIKGRFKRGYYNADSDRDIEYLLTKLEIANKVLEETRNNVGMIDASKGNEIDVKYKLAALDAISNSLKSIRED